MESTHTYICIDLRSYYASVECVSRGLDPMKARLVVADPARGAGTICLAVSPAMKAAGVRNRCRVHDIPSTMDYIKATPRMRRYMEVSAEIFGIYLEHIAAEDVHIYSVDECFIDVTSYLPYYKTNAVDLAKRLMNEVLVRTGIPSTCGIGENMFLAKVALDIEAKHSPNGISKLNREEFFERIWHHRPITDIWGIGHRTAERLAAHGVHDLCELACSNLDSLVKEFGVNANLLYDHAWGIEPCTIRQIKDYVPRSSSITTGQVLFRNYATDEARIVLHEMAHEAVLELNDRASVCGRVSVRVGYSFDHVSESGNEAGPSTGTAKLDMFTASHSVIVPTLLSLFDKVAQPRLSIRRLSIGLSDLLPAGVEAIPLFFDEDALEEERALMTVIAEARKKFGRDALMWGSSLKECATGLERARQIGGHRA